MPSKSKSNVFRPMLAGLCEDIASVRLPVMASPKLDGIRCLIHPDHGPITRNIKPVPNTYIRNQLKKLPYFDGELMVGELTAGNVWNVSSSGIMSEAGKPDFTFQVFDVFPKHPGEPFAERYKMLATWCVNMQNKTPVRLVKHTTFDSHARVKEYENRMVEAGFEGIMLRDPAGLFKNGRSSTKEGWLLKFKRFHDAEATIKGFKEKQHNANEAKVNALGYTERSSHKANKQPMGTLGALIVRAKLGTNGGFFGNEVEFDIGTGFDDAMRAKIWRERGKCMGKQVRFKYQKLSPNGLPIFPVFQGFRQD